VFDRLFEDGEALRIARAEARVVHTPEHAPVCVTYVVSDAALVGDTLFMPGDRTVRADFPGGGAATLYRPRRGFFVGQGHLPEGRSRHAWETTVADERTANIHVHDGIAEDEFVKLRTARDRTLAAPKLILPSLQVNIRGGALPKPDGDGRVYLKTPVSMV